MKCEQCGRPALALVRVGKKRSRKARAGQPRKIKDHSLCAECWEKQGDSQRTTAAMRTLGEGPRSEAELRAIIAEARAALASGNVAQAERVLAKEAA